MCSRCVVARFTENFHLELRGEPQRYLAPRHGLARGTRQFLKPRTSGADMSAGCKVAGE